MPRGAWPAAGAPPRWAAARRESCCAGEDCGRSEGPGGGERSRASQGFRGAESFRGSEARGDARASSDVDLMITVSDAWYATHNRFEVLGVLWNKLSRHGVPLDLLLYPRSKVEERRHWLSHVIAQAHREGRVLDGPL